MQINGKGFPMRESASVNQLKTRKGVSHVKRQVHINRKTGFPVRAQVHELAV
jgi:hypothetical protein